MNTEDKIVLALGAIALIAIILHRRGLLTGALARTRGMTPLTQAQTINIVICVACYVFGLWFIATEFPNFWNAWWSPSYFFWVSNLVFGAFLCASIVAKQWWGTLGAVVIFGWILFHGILGARVPKEGSGYATKTIPVEVYLNPKKGFIISTEEGKYIKVVFKTNPSIFYNGDHNPENTNKVKKLEQLP